MAAHETWRAAVKQAEDRAGITATRDAGDREQRLINDLRLRVAATSVHTTDGLFAKARVTVDPLSGDDLHWPEREHLPERLAQWAKAPVRVDQAAILALSLLVDVLRLDRNRSAA